MLTRARELMPVYGASFLITGEVLGQRPMSQRRDTLRVIERDSGCDGLLLRPLSAKKMLPTGAELAGLVDRERLYGFSGRSRKQQKLLAAQLGITDYPTPAGGCMLTDPNLASRIRHFYNGLFSFGEQHAVTDLRLLAVGRQFKLDDHTWFILGRNERENLQLETLRGPDDWLLRMTTRPGPLGLLRCGRQQEAGSNQEATIVRQLAGLVIRYGKKDDGLPMEAEVIIDKGGRCETGWFAPLAAAESDPWRM
jgi:tRNA-uridine 2-sulfurtransferase